MKAETTLQSDDLLMNEKEKIKGKKIALHFKKLEMINDIKSKILNSYNNNEPEEILIYGLTIFFFENESKIKKGIIYINEKEENSLIFLDLKAKLTTKIQLSKLADINLGKNSGNFKACEKKISKLEEDKCLTMHMKDKTKFYDLIFSSKEDLEKFCLGIVYTLEKMINDSKNLKRDIISLKQIWKQYVSDQDKKHLNFQQFSKFLRNICFKWKKKSDEEIFKEIDIKNQGKIGFKDFISFYEFLVTGEEFTEIFQKYSSDEEKKYITIRGLLDFMEKEQHLKVSAHDIFLILHKFSKKSKKFLESTGLINKIREGMIDVDDYINSNDLNANQFTTLNNGNVNNNLKNNNLINVPQNSIDGHLNPVLSSNTNIVNNLITKGDQNVKNYDALPHNKNNNNQLGSSANLNLKKSKNDCESKLVLSNKNNTNNKDYTNTNKNILDHESLQAIYDNYSFGKNNLLDDIKEGRNEDLYSTFCLSFREFVNFLIDKSYNSIYNHDLFSLHQNMNLPIHDYFIYSSHNTYLEGNQMIGNSSVDMYTNCLKNGCRLVELDCWDGKNGPIITHWHFPVNKLEFKDVLKNIKEVAFKKSPYPVIFSIENHCNNTNQSIMAQHFSDIIGKENLFIVDVENPPLAYPSPNDLKHKFIIKCKRKRILGKKEDYKKLLENNNNNFNTNNNMNLTRKISNTVANVQNKSLSGNNNNNLQNYESNSNFCNIEAESIHMNQMNTHSNNNEKNNNSNLNNNNNIQYFSQTQNLDNNLIQENTENNSFQNCYTHGDIINNNNQNYIVSSANKSNGNSHFPYNSFNVNNFNGDNNDALYPNHNIEENKKNILRMVQKEEIIEEVNSNKSFINTSYNENQYENLLDSSNEHIYIPSERYKTQETNLISEVKNGKRAKNKHFQIAKSLKNIHPSHKISNLRQNSLKNEGNQQKISHVVNFEIANYSPAFSCKTDNRLNLMLKPEKNLTELEEVVVNMNKNSSEKNLRSICFSKKDENENYNKASNCDIQFCKENVSSKETEQVNLNKNFSLSSTEFTSRPNNIKRKLEFENLSTHFKKNHQDDTRLKKNQSLFTWYNRKNNPDKCLVKYYDSTQKELDWHEKIKLANKEVKSVLETRNKILEVNESWQENNNFGVSNTINNNYDINAPKINSQIILQSNENKNKINDNQENTNILGLLTTPNKIQNQTNRSSIHVKNSVSKVEKGNLKNITHTGIIIPQKPNEEPGSNDKPTLPALVNSNKKEDEGIKIKYLQENKELKFKYLNIEIKDPLPGNIETDANNNYGNQNQNNYEIYKIKNKKKKKKKSILNLSLESEISDPLNEIQVSRPTNSNKVFEKLKIKYLINENKQIENNNINTNIINEDGAYALQANNLNSHNNNNDFEVLTRMHEIRTLDELKPSTIKIKTIDKLAAVIGMIGVKYKQKDFDNGLYLPWECVSIAEPDFNKYISNVEERIKLIKFCQKSFIKTYPDVVKRTDSSNQDPINSWAAGVQIVALNLQKLDDDMILINKIFFKLNGGSRSGYILKPDILRNPNCDESIKKMCSKVAFKIKFKILSGFHLHLCFPEKTKITGLYVEVSLRSPYNNDSLENKKLITNTIENNFLHPIWISSSIYYEVYDPDLTFIIIKIFSKKKSVIARSVIPVKFMNLGIRVVDLYDNYCSKFENSFLIVKCNKILVDK